MGNMFGMIRPIILMFWSIVANFLFCEFGESLTSQCNELNDVICQSEWYLLPVDLQRMLPTIMLTTQKPNILQGFGGVSLTREAFKAVRYYTSEYYKKIMKMMTDILSEY